MNWLRVLRWLLIRGPEGEGWEGMEEIIIRNWDTRELWSSKPKQGSCTPEFSDLLVSTTSFPSPSPISLILVQNSTIITEYKVKLSRSISPCHNDQVTPSTAYTKSTAYTEYSIHQEYSIHWVQHTPRVQHTPSTAYTEYSIHWIQHPLQIICGPIILMIRNWPQKVARASVVPHCTIHRHQPALCDSWKVKSYCQIPTVASYLND